MNDQIEEVLAFWFEGVVENEYLAQPREGFEAG